jgi:hypothetical protein
VHRVVNPHGLDRISMATFFQPNYHSLLEPAPACVGPGQAPRYTPVTQGALFDHYYQGISSTGASCPPPGAEHISDDDDLQQAQYARQAQLAQQVQQVQHTENAIAAARAAAGEQGSREVSWPAARCGPKRAQVADDGGSVQRSAREGTMHGGALCRVSSAQVSASLKRLLAG